MKCNLGQAVPIKQSIDVPHLIPVTSAAAKLHQLKHWVDHL